MSRFLYRLGHFSVRHRRWMLGFWLALLVGLGVAASIAGGSTSNKFALPGTESQEAFDLLGARFRAQSGSTALIVFAARKGSTISDSTGAIQAALGHVNGQQGVRPIDPAASLVVSPDGTVAYAQVSYV